MSIRATVIFAQVNYVRPRATDIHLVTDMKQYFFYETATLSEVIGVATQKPRSDSFAFSDFSFVSINKLKSENLSLTEAISLVANYERAVNDNITLSLTTSFVSDTNTVQNETANIDDLIGLSLNRPVSGDSFGIGDQITPNFGKGVNETLSFSETVALVMQYNSALNDSLSMQEQAALSLSRTFADGFGLDDATTINKNYDGNKGNVIGLTEQVSLSRTFGRAFGNNTLNSITLN